MLFRREKKEKKERKERKPRRQREPKPEREFNRKNSNFSILKSRKRDEDFENTPGSLDHMFLKRKIEEIPSTLTASQRYIVDAAMAGKNVFFTGCAGTGKTYLLEYLLKALPKDGLVVTATTGIAAVALQGTTIHSFAGIGFGEEPVGLLLSKVIRSRRAKNRWLDAKILIIDEISMLDAGLFDKLEYIGRKVRGGEKPFGGIQLLCTGDFLQLPPVSKQGAAKFAFEAESWSRCLDVTVELDQVFRQSDSSFQSILADFRRGVCSKSGLASLAICAQRKLSAEDGIVPTMLYSKRIDVSRHNEEELAKLSGKPMEFKAQDGGSDQYSTEMLARSCPAPAKLILKEGAQVLLIKNVSVTEGLANGSRGVVVGFQEEKGKTLPLVKFMTGAIVAVGPEKWEMNQGKTVLASRIQIPLILAWSLTIHKCQGMTIDKVCLSLESVFEYGQAYVALSRVRALEGLKLNDFTPNVIKAHPKALRFYQTLPKMKIDIVETKIEPLLRPPEGPTSEQGAKPLAEDIEELAENELKSVDKLGLGDVHHQDQHGEDHHGEDHHGEDHHGEDHHGEDHHGEDHHGGPGGDAIDLTD